MARWGDREGRRREILRAARKLLEKKGYDAFNMRDVARDAGITAGLLYTYFASKEALFAVLYAERLDKLNDDIAPACAKATSPEKLFVEIADRYRELYEVYGRAINVWSMILESDAAVAEPLASAAARVLFTLEAALDRLVKPRDKRLALPLLWATVTGLCDQYSGGRHLLHGATWEEVSRFAARTLARGLEEK